MAEPLTAKKSLIWYWKKRPIMLNKLEDNQLYYVQATIMNGKHKAWFGTRSKVWLDAIEELAKKRQKQNIEDISNEIMDRRIKRAEVVAEKLTNGIIKAFEKNVYTQTQTI